MTLIKMVGGYLAEITISEALEIVTCHWGRWVSEEDVTISKQTFRLVLYPLRKPRGLQFCNMVIGKDRVRSKSKIRIRGFKVRIHFDSMFGSVQVLRQQVFPKRNMDSNWIRT